MGEREVGEGGGGGGGRERERERERESRKPQAHKSPRAQYA